MKTDPRALTPKLLQSLTRANPTERTILKDGATPGLRLRHEVSGSMFWNLNKRVSGGKARQHVLGTYPEVSLAEARKLAAEISVEAAKGIDRMAEAREAADKLEACSVEAALDRYLTMKKRNGVKTADDFVGHMRRHLAPYGLLTEPMAALTLQDFHRILTRKAEGDADGRGRVMAVRLYAYFRTWLRWAFDSGLIETEMHLRLRKPDVKERARERVLSIAEVQAIYQAAGEMRSWRHRNFVRVLLLTGMRRGEINDLTHDEIRLSDGRIEIAGSRMKSGKAHTAPLSTLTCEILRETLEDLPQKPMPFGLHAISRIKRKMDDLSGVTDWTFHDFRRAMATHLVESGTAPGVVDRILAHSGPGVGTSLVAKIYERAELMDDRRDAIEKWARMVDPITQVDVR